MQQNVTNWSADCLYLSANSGRSDMHCCSAKTSSLFITSLALDMESHKMYYCVFFLAVSSTVYLCFIAIQFYRAYAPLQLRVIRLTSVSQTKLILLFAKYKGYLKVNFLPQVLWQQRVNLKKNTEMSFKQQVTFHICWFIFLYILYFQCQIKM